MTEPTAEDRVAIMSMAWGHMVAHTLAAAVRLGVADGLARGEREAGELAAELGTAPQPTLRLLRGLAALEVAAEPRPGVFTLAPRGALLRSDREDSLADFVSMFLAPAMTAPWVEVDHSVRTGSIPFEQVHGADFFTYYADRPDASRVFNAAMRQGTYLVASVLVEALDLAGAASVTDVGGGDGTLLAAVLAANPHLRGVLFDTAPGLAESGPVLEKAGVADRSEAVAGDFFASVPAGSDAYLFKSIVHDWNDEQVVTILRHVREGITPGGRVIVLEPLLPPTVDGSLPPLMYLSDLHMMINVAGRERTEAEFREVFERSGFALSAVTPLPPSGFSVIEAVPA